jgi:ankyrin repeat protein
MHMEDAWFERGRLHFAAQDGALERVKELVSKGYPLNSFDEIGKTPLHYAAENERLDVAKFLIKAGADVNAHDEATIGNTPLAEIAGNCSLAMATLLIEAGADPTIRGWMQLNALDRAKTRKRGDGPDVYQLLLRAACGK